MKQDRPIRFGLIMVGLNMVCYLCMVECRKRYKLEIKQPKERQRQRRGDYVESLLDNNDVNFWKQWKKVKKKSQNVKTVNADIQLVDGLLNNFSKKYVDSKDNTDLFKKFMYNYDLMGKEYANDNDKVLMLFSIEEIEKGVNDLNLGRAGDRNDLSIEHVIYANPIIYHHLCALFAMIMKHGHVPDDFKLGVIIPIVKDKRKGLGDVDNYRPITIISVFLSYLKFAFIIKLMVV